MRKVVCVICRAIFKVREDPPPSIVADGDYSLSALRLTGDPEAVDNGAIRGTRRMNVNAK